MVRLVVDGQLVSKDYLCVSPLDRAVLYGESAFELLRVYDGRPFEPARHFSELARACDLLSIPRPATQTLFEDLALATGGLPGDLAVRVQVTRGNPAFELLSRRLVTASVPVTPPREAYADGVSVTCDVSLVVRANAYFSGLKWGGYGAQLRATDRARAAGAYEALALDETGAVVEGATSNILALVAGQLVAPGQSSGARPGVTRSVIIDSARARGLTVRESAISQAELHAASEVFIASSVRELVPVASVDGEPVGDGSFALTRELHRELRRRAGARGALPWEP